MFVGTSIKTPQRTAQFAILIDGVEQPLYRSRLDGELYVVGVPGKAYTLSARNLSHTRVEILNSVDGRNTLKDEAADPRAGRGLVFRANAAGTFSGWRINNNETREFVFGRPETAIATQATGSTSNVGIIGFAVYTERVPVPSYDHGYGNPYGGNYRGETKGMNRGGGLESMEAGVELSAPASFGPSLGSGMGALQTDQVGTTHFERATSEPEIVNINYHTEEVLRSLGILAPAGPNAWPGKDTGYGQYNTVR